MQANNLAFSLTAGEAAIVTADQGTKLTMHILPPADPNEPLPPLIMLMSAVLALSSNRAWVEETLALAMAAAHD